MKTISFKFGILLVFILTISSCSRSRNSGSTYKIPVPEYVYTKDGRVENFTLDESKPKVFTIIVGLDYFEFVYFYTPPNKINRIIADNPEYEFLFYFVFPPQDSLKFFGKLEQYNVDYPVFADYDDELRKQNRALKKIVTYTMLGNKENKFVNCATIGTSQSFFDQTFEKAKRTHK